jgi:type I restriction enzyme M protein
MSENNKLESTLWKTADKLRNNMDAAEYKHVVLGLIFLKYISDSFDDLYKKLKTESSTTGADPEDKDEYHAERVFYVPPQARWSFLQNRAKLPIIGKDVDDAMDAIEKDNPSLKGVLPKDYARPALDKQRLGELIDLIGSITLTGDGVIKEKMSLDLCLNTSWASLPMQKERKGGNSIHPRA